MIKIEMEILSREQKRNHNNRKKKVYPSQIKYTHTRQKKYFRNCFFSFAQKDQHSFPALFEILLRLSRKFIHVLKGF